MSLQVSSIQMIHYDHNCHDNKKEEFPHSSGLLESSKINQIYLNAARNDDTDESMAWRWEFAFHTFYR